MADTKTNMRKKASSSSASLGSLPDRAEILADYRLCVLSREASVIARKEVLMGRANFGIIGDGKEVAQVAMARAWRKGDFRSGYYRDQTLVLALGLMTLEEFFAQLYGDPHGDPFSSGRQMNCHFATRLVDEQGAFIDHRNRFNISADIAPTGGQMARGLGLAFASKKFREHPEICGALSDRGQEVCFVTIGDASTSEGAFWETVNAAGVLQVPLAISVWDDGYGISVPKRFQTSKESISAVLAGFQIDNDVDPSGLDIYTGKGWDYSGLCALYEGAVARMRDTHRPALFHIQEVTQQLGHSTSGDHRRYKSPERLVWEQEYDCNRRMADWMVASGIATQEELDAIQESARAEATEAARRAYAAYHNRVDARRSILNARLDQLRASDARLEPLHAELSQLRAPLRFELVRLARRAAAIVPQAESALADFIDEEMREGRSVYSTNLYSQTPRSALKVPVQPAVYGADAPIKDGFEVLNACFDHHLNHNPAFFAFGEDVGRIGDVNQAFRGMQEKYGSTRVFDTGIREWTIMGQAIGMAMRGLRPVAEIQYLDYLLYGLSPLSDDLATLRWRTNGLQAAPAIIRTRGHRLVGVWHAGSPMGMILGSLRGMYICVPRNMTQAAGMYNTLLQGDDPALVIECLNGYRIKEVMPENPGTFTVPLGVPEVVRQGTDVTLVTYGSSVGVGEEACARLEALGISVELLDVQTLLPFDLPGICLQSLRKTNRLAILDEDFEGGASAYILQQILEKNGGYYQLDAPPATIYARDHRPAYGQDGDYHSKPQVEDVVDRLLQLVREEY
jgi:pyruvate/2-oxoglutarate/acetoin dehydrogenase E1 component/TPP-dependent pyruvate/acetoin dehydrogenase alpha subunit